MQAQPLKWVIVFPKDEHQFMENTSYTIETQGLKKVYENTIAVKNLTLQVEQGEVFGFLGANGAGKTTAIKMFLGLIKPTAGWAKILGADLNNASQMRAACRQIGFLPEHFRFHDWLTAEEFLTLHGRLYGMEANLLSKRLAELLDLVELTPSRKKLLRNFSKGMLQRIGIAQALLNSPKLVILDEPTSGLDPLGRRLVRDILNELSSKGVCIFLNSHILSEIEVTCHRVAFIKQGEVRKIIYVKSLEEKNPRLRIQGKNISRSMLDGLRCWAQNIMLEGDILTLQPNQEADIPQVVCYLVQQGVDITAVQPEKPTLEELFIQIVGKESET